MTWRWRRPVGVEGRAPEGMAGEPEVELEPEGESWGIDEGPSEHSSLGAFYTNQWDKMIRIAS